MKVLHIHADKVFYEITGKTKLAESITDDMKKCEMKDVLFTRIAIETDDEKNTDSVIDNAITDIVDVSSKIGTKKILLYPYVHLLFGSKPGNANTAIQILDTMKEKLTDMGFEVRRAPFGYYKRFEVICKGHPLSELSREISTKTKEIITREEIVKEIRGTYYLITSDGKETKINIENVDNINIEIDDTLKKYILAEHIPVSQEPPSIKTMQKLELVDYEEASDSGHFRFYPKGNLVFNLIKEWVDTIAHEKLNVIEIDTPILYDWSMPDIRDQASSFHQRHYTVETPDGKRNFVLRFAGDFGLFRMLKTSNISYKALPFRVYEFSKSFRYEQRGELSGLRRLRAFHMPDIHSFTANLSQGLKEFAELHKTYIELTDGMGIEYAIVFRVAEDFYKERKKEIIEIIKSSDKPTLVEVLSKQKHYWVIKSEFQAIDSVGGNTQLATVQLDLEDAERYGIMYTDKNGQKKGCVICHSSIGSIERLIYSVLENALKKPKPELPFWLTPTQVRLIPVSEEYIDDCETLRKKIKARVDIDDRDEKVSRKIRDAEREWINMIIVYGEKEKDSDRYPIRFRNGKIEIFTLEELNTKINELMREYPYKSLDLPVYLSRRIIFR